MVDCGNWRMDVISLTVSSLRSRASRSLLLVASARAVICPNNAGALTTSIRSSGLKVIAPSARSQGFLHGFAPQAAQPRYFTRSAPVSRQLQMNFEKSLRRLDEIMAALETEQVGLDASLKLFEEGIQLLREASAELDKADTKVQLLIERSEGGFELRETDL